MRSAAIALAALLWVGMLGFGATGCGDDIPPGPMAPPLPPRARVQDCQPMDAEGQPLPTLAETGCFSDVPGVVPAPDLVPYGVASPLWTDGAHKERWVSIPPDVTLGFEDGVLTLPLGGILVKLFAMDILVDGQRTRRNVEVRIFTETPAGTRLFSYVFDESGQTATLVTEPQTFEFIAADGGHTVNYYLPSEESCMICHGSSLQLLGFSTEQLNFTHNYGPSVANQLDALEEIGMIDVMQAPADLPALVTPAQPGDLETRARAWLHANCAHCHRPGGWAPIPDLDFRFDTSLSESGICSPMMFFGSFSHLRRVQPGMPEASGLLLRVEAEGLERMPPIGVSVTDPLGSALLREWITSLQSCP